MSPRPSGLHLREQYLSGKGQLYCLMDFGLASTCPKEAAEDHGEKEPTFISSSGMGATGRALPTGGNPQVWRTIPRRNLWRNRDVAGEVGDQERGDSV
jgi:hypothetical protein